MTDPGTCGFLSQGPGRGKPMFQIGMKYVMDGDQIVTCKEADPEVARFEDESRDLEFVTLKDEDGIWRHETSGAEFAARQVVQMTDEQAMEVHDHLVDAGNMLFGEEGEARSAIELNLAEDILTIEEKIEGVWRHLFPKVEEEGGD